jgi:hypothetical protein
MPNLFVQTLSFSFACFLAAAVFFRKKNVGFLQAFLPVFLSIYHPSQIKKNIKTEGIVLVFCGYLAFIAYAVFWF